jgi:hypothetical protein
MGKIRKIYASSRESACIGKVAYRNMDEARSAARRRTHDYDYDGSILDAYRCGFCKQYHYGRRPAAWGT